VIGQRRIAAMEAWIDLHGSSLTESEWDVRLSRVETFREVVAKRRSDWLLAAHHVAKSVERMSRHLDRQRIQDDWSLDFTDVGTSDRSIRRQWAHYLKPDYDPCPF
jgi:hypothetical protein